MKMKFMIEIYNFLQIKNKLNYLMIMIILQKVIILSQIKILLRKKNMNKIHLILIVLNFNKFLIFLPQYC